MQFSSALLAIRFFYRLAVQYALQAAKPIGQACENAFSADLDAAAQGFNLACA